MFIHIHDYISIVKILVIIFAPQHLPLHLRPRQLRFRLPYDSQNRSFRFFCEAPLTCQLHRISARSPDTLYSSVKHLPKVTNSGLCSFGTVRIHTKASYLSPPHIMVPGHFESHHYQNIHSRQPVSGATTSTLLQRNHPATSYTRTPQLLDEHSSNLTRTTWDSQGLSSTGGVGSQNETSIQRKSS